MVGCDGKRLRLLVFLMVLAGIAGTFGCLSAHAQVPRFAGNPRGPLTNGEQTAVFAGGCFWGVDAVFKHMKGVTRVVSGYAGGSATAAHYETVSTGATGHAESVEVKFDSSKVSYADLLRVFFSVAHDPTELNRQGLSIVRRFSMPVRTRSKRHWSTSPNSTRPALSRRQSSPRSFRSRNSIPPKPTTRISSGAIPITRTSFTTIFRSCASSKSSSPPCTSRRGCGSGTDTITFHSG